MKWASSFLPSWVSIGCGGRGDFCIQGELFPTRLLGRPRQRQLSLPWDLALGRVGAGQGRDTVFFGGTVLPGLVLVIEGLLRDWRWGRCGALGLLPGWKTRPASLGPGSLDRDVRAFWRGLPGGGVWENSPAVETEGTTLGRMVARDGCHGGGHVASL